MVLWLANLTCSGILGLVAFTASKLNYAVVHCNALALIYDPINRLWQIIGNVLLALDTDLWRFSCL